MLMLSVTSDNRQHPTAAAPVDWKIRLSAESLERVCWPRWTRLVCNSAFIIDLADLFNHPRGVVNKMIFIGH